MSRVISGTYTNGIYLGSSGTSVAITATGNVTGTSYALFGSGTAAWTITNAGQLTGGNNGVILTLGTLVNSVIGTISGGYRGIVASGTVAVTNAGVITGGSNYGIGLFGGGSVTNQSSGTISGARGGIFIEHSAGTVTNAGSIAEGSSRAVALFVGGTVTNTGTIGGTGQGVLIDTATGAVTNTGAIYAGTNAVNLASGGTVTNAGSIHGGTDAVLFGAGFANRLIVDPGAAFTGTVDGGNTVGGTIASTLELAAGAAAGQIAGLGTQFINFAQTTIDAGALWTLDGANSLAAGTTLANSGALTIFDGSLADAGNVINNGVIQDTAATLTLGTLAGTGEVLIGAGGTLDVTGTVAATEAIVLGAGGMLQIGNTVTNNGQLAGGNDGVNLSGGTVTNNAAGSITGQQTGIVINSGTGAVTNAGGVTGVGAYGVSLSGGSVTNLSSGTISGGIRGIAASGTVAVTNAGVITGGSDYGIGLGGGGSVTNLSSGTISGGSRGIAASGTVAVTNAGVITGGSDYGIGLGGGGSVTNLSGGTISGAHGGIFVERSAGTVTNAGSIAEGSGRAVALFAGGTVTNTGTIGGTGQGVVIDTATGAVTNTGAIYAGTNAVYLFSGGTVTNAGSIHGGTDAVLFRAGFANRLIVDPGAAFTGTVDGGNTVGGTIASTLELAAGAAAGQIAGLGTQFINFAQTTIDAGALWTLDGANSLAAGTTLANSGELTLFDGSLADAGNVINNGVIQDTAATLTLGTLAGTGEVLIGAGGTLDVTGTVAATEAIVLGAGGMLQIGNTVTNNGQLAGGNDGVNLSGGTVTNNAAGSITGQQTGIVINSGTGAVTNAGGITGVGAYGVSLSGGSVTNLSSGTISGGFRGIGASGTVAVTNAGVITGVGAYGVSLSGGSVTNLSSGTISSGFRGIGASGTVAVTNAGVITGGSDYGIGLFGGGSVTNLSSGTISGGYRGIGASGTVAVTNAGVITGGSDYGIGLGGGGSVTNLSGGTISGAHGGIFIEHSAGTVTNAGSIAEGSGRAVALFVGGTVTNTGTIGGTGQGVLIDTATGAVTNTGAIYAGTNAVYLFSGGTVTNAGSIHGGTDAVLFGAGFANRLIVDPGATFTGTVDGGNTVGGTIASTLELAAGAAAGQIAGLGTQFINFAQTTIDAGAIWTLDGANSLAAGTTLTNAGVLTVLDGALADAGTIVNTNLIQETAATLTAGALTGTGEVVIGAASTLIATGTVGVGQTVDFAGTGLLSILPGSFSGQIDGLGGGGRIALSGISDAISATLVNVNTLAIAQSTGPTIDLTLDPTQSYAGVAFVIGTSGGVSTVLAAQRVGPTVIGAGTTLGLSGSGASLLAASGGGTGGITVTGAGSTLTTTGSFVVGDTSLGSLAIQSGGSMAATGGAIVGNTSGASGSTADVTGTGSDWQVTGQLTVGNTGYGQMSVSAGGAASTGSLDAGAGTGGTGVVEVVGAGSTLSVSGGLTVGDKGAGSLSILNGGQISATNVTVGASTGGQGDLVIGAGSTLHTTGTVNVGLASSGVLEIQGGTIHSTNAITKGSFGHVIQIGGRIDPLDQDITGFLFSNGGELDVGATITNSGNSLLTIPSVSQGSETFLAPLMTHGTAAAGIIDVDVGGTLILDVNTVDASQTILFTDPSAELVIGQQVTIGALDQQPTLIAASALGGFAAKIDGYTTGNVIVVDTNHAAGFSYVTGGTVIAVDDLVSGQPTGTQEGSLTFTSAAAAQQAFTDLGNATASLQDQVIACFAEGTRIRTVAGQVAVETLRAGDLVRTAGGALRPVRWIGHRTIDLTRHPDPRRAQPIRIVADAFADGAPSRDLLLSPDHAVFDRGRLIPIRLLVNDATIRRETRRRKETYYHVELDTHDLLLAEDLPVESFLDCGNRGIFENAPEPLILHPDFLDPAAQQRRRLAISCAPLCDAAAEIEPVWFRLADRALALGVPLPEPAFTDEPALAVLAGGARLAPIARDGMRYRFAVPAGVPLRLVSRAAYPSDALPWLEDQRRLGVMVRALMLGEGDAATPIALDDPALARGWWAPESDGVSHWRWTDGAGLLPALAAASVLEVTLAGTLPYPRPARGSRGAATKAA